jgi:arginine/lysine/ornithine decarboxylase
VERSQELTQERAPVLESLLEHLRERRRRFHVPGHKGGRGAFRELASLLGSDLLRLDLTELYGLDDPHWPAPDGPVRAAETLAARYYGAGEARFLVGGATAGVLAMVLATVGPGQTLLATLPFHRSVAAAAVLSGCRLHAVEPRFVGRLLPTPATPDAVAQAAGRARPAAILVTSPTYHGVAVDFEGFAALSARLGVPLLVDAAHGAHFGASRTLPPAPTARGVSACVVSLHKTAGALTPGALLLTGGGCADRGPTGRAVDAAALERALRLVQTSSPPFPLLVSLDLARRRLALHGQNDWERACRLADRTRERVRRRGGPWLRPFPEGGRRVGQSEGRDGHLPESWDDLRLDGTRMVFEIAPEAPDALTGQALAAAAARVGVDLEMAGWADVVAVVTPADTAADHDRLVQALAALPGEALGASRSNTAPKRELALSLEKDCWEAPRELVVPPSEAFRGRRRRVPAARAAGCVAADVICPYPPGVPVAIPGQRIDEAVARYLALLARGDCRVQGMAFSEIEVVG